MVDQDRKMPAVAGGAHRQAQQHRGDVHQLVLHRFVQPLGDAAFLEQVAKHQAADQGSGRGQQQPDKDGDGDVAMIFSSRDTGRRVFIWISRSFFGGQRPHDGG